MEFRRGRLASMVLFGGAFVALAVPAVAAAAKPYVALGDSYSSGVGTRVYYNDGSNCSRSPDAYGPLIAAKDGYTLSFEACSGATTADVISGQLGPLSGSTNLVTITIGGNDAGFSNVIENCAIPFFNCQGAINTADSYIQNTLSGVLNTTYNDIRARATTAHVVVLGYPRLFTSNGATCNFDALTSSEEIQLNHSADLLDGVISSEASSHKFTYVDPRNAFSSHAVCSNSEWLNGLSWPISESFHPNVSGQADFASQIEAVLP